jgi:hypothetical protein
VKTTLPLLPEPRSYAGTATLLGAVTGLPFTVLYAWLVGALLQRPFGEMLPCGLGAGVFFGVSFGLVMARCFKGETATVKVAEPKGFVQRLNVALAQLGYHPATQAEDFLTYRPSVQAGLAAGRVSVQLRDGQAVIVGPKLYVEKLLTRLAND